MSDKKKGKDKKEKDKKGKDKKDKDKKGEKKKDAPSAAGSGSVVPTQYHQEKIQYQYAAPRQDPRAPFQPPVGIDEVTRALFISSSLAFRSVDLDGNGDLSPGEFKTAMKKLNYFVPKPAGAPAASDKKDKKGKGDKKQKKDAKGLWSDLFKAIDKDGGGTIDEREFTEYYVWAQKKGYGQSGGNNTGMFQPGQHSAAHGAAFLGMGAPTNQFQWNKVEGSLVKISAAGANICGVNADGQIWKFTGQGWTAVPGSATHVACGSDGSTWCITPTDEIYRWGQAGSWEQVPGSLSVISVSNAMNVWGCNKANEIYNWNGQMWNKIDGVGKYISVGDDGSVWVVNPAGEIWRRPGVQGTWEQVQGSLVTVSVFNQNSVVGTNAEGQIWAWTGAGWTQSPGSAKSISVGSALNNSVWAVTPTNEIYRHGV